MNRTIIRKCVKIKLAALLASAALHGNAHAAVLVLQDGLNGYSGTRDTHIVSQTNKQHDDYGSNTDLLIRQQTDNDKHSLIYFDLSPLPSYSSVDSVASITLSLYKAEGDQNPYNVRVYAVTNGPWQEGDGNNNTPDHADWIHKIHNSSNSTDAWNTPGLGAADYDGSTDPITTVTTNHQWYTWDVSLIVTDWWSGAATNYGFFLDSVGSEGERHFNSSDNRENRPKLTIDYKPKTTPGPNPTVPEPGSLAFLGLGAFAFIGRKRRMNG